MSSNILWILKKRLVFWDRMQNRCILGENDWLDILPAARQREERLQDSHLSCFCNVTSFQPLCDLWDFRPKWPFHFNLIPSAHLLCPCSSHPHCSSFLFSFLPLSYLHHLFSCSSLSHLDSSSLFMSPLLPFALFPSYPSRTSTTPLPSSTMRSWAAISGITCILLASNFSWVTLAADTKWLRSVTKLRGSTAETTWPH